MSVATTAHARDGYITYRVLGVYHTNCMPNYNGTTAMIYSTYHYLRRIVPARYKIDIINDRTINC